MKVLATPTSFLKPQNACARAILEQYADVVVYNETGVPLRGDELLNLSDGVDGIVAGVDYYSKEVIKEMPACVKVISRYGAGFDRIDLNACNRRGIVVTNTPGANATAVCELAFGLMLSCARNIPELHQQVCECAWPRANGMELAGKTIGIIGLGAIGKKLATRAQAFDMKVLTYDPYLDESYVRENSIQATDLDELIQNSDIISLHVPLNSQTYHLINGKRIAAMKEGAIIINTARGGLIDENAAASAIRAGHLRGIGLDVFEQEPLRESPLKGLPGVVFTPHTGAHTTEAVINMGLMAVNNLIDILEGRPNDYILNGR